MKKLYSFCLCLAAILMSMSAMAQQTVKGTVVDEAGQPVIGATVIVKGTTQGTTTGMDGRFQIAVPAKGEIQISFLGYITENIADFSKTQFVLKEDRQNIEEVVVVGYGSQKKAHLTGSVATVNVDDVKDITSGSLAATLEGMMPGVSVSGGEARPGENASISIRDVNSLDAIGSSGGQPLFVIDGFIQSSSVFNNLDPSMVASISVLKDASAAVYGARAANGVVLVQTKRGTLGTPKISYSGSIGITDEISRPKMLNAYQYGKLWNAVQGADPTKTNLNATLDLFQKDELEAMKHLNYDLLDQYWEAAVKQRHSVTLSGATEKANYFAGISYFDQGGNLGKLDYNSWSYRAGADMKIGNWVKASLQISGDYSDKTSPTVKVGSSNSEDYNMLLSHPRYIPETVDGKPISVYGPSNTGKAGGREDYNFGLMQELGDMGNTMTQNMSINASLEWDLGWIKPLRGLKTRLSYGKNISTSKTNQEGSAFNIYQMVERYGSGQHLYTPTGIEDGTIDYLASENFTVKEIYNGPELGYHSRSMNRSDSYQLNWVVNYARDFGKHSVSALFSIERSESETEDNATQVTDLYSFGTGQSNSVGQNSVLTGSFGRSESGTLSYLGRLNYAYDDKYLFEFLFRSDASTKFAPENYWGYFPSASLGWVVSQEDWFADNVSWIDFLKIRASFGLTGRDNTTAWQWMQTYTTDLDKGAILTENGLAGSRLSIKKELAAVNRDAHWDKSYKSNFGIDWNILNNRLGFTIEGYYEWNREILMPYVASVPGTVGTASANMNVGEMDSWGVEFSATWNDRIGKDFKYKINLNTGYSDNKVLFMDWDTDQLFMQIEKGDRTDQGSWGLQCLGMFRSFQDIEEYFAKYNITSYMGMTKDQVRPGMLIYKDVRGPQQEDLSYAGPDGVVDNELDLVRLSNRSNPYGLTANLSAEWKGLSIAAQIQASWGGYTFVSADARKPKYDLEYNSMPSFWNPDNMFVYEDIYDGSGNLVVEQNLDGQYPSLAYGINTNQSSFWRVSAASVTLRRLTLAYTIPSKYTSKIGLSSVRFNVTGTNLLNFYNPYPDKFMNPMAGSYGKYPNLRSVTIGVNVTF